MAIDVETRLTLLEEKVQELSDREAIRELRCYYHDYINTGKLAEIAGLFIEDGELDFAHMGQGKGRAFQKKFFEGLSNYLSTVKQFIHCQVIEVNGDTATGFSYLEAKPVFKGESFLVAGRYDDEYVRENGKWKFKKMKFTPYFMVPLKEGWAQEQKIKMGGKVSS
ncbi:MAG: nuclear transport factor 2 family protein [Candidatus Binataceae bacterium]|jgi:ketosteroid isomerase-like protein